MIVSASSRGRLKLCCGLLTALAVGAFAPQAALGSFPGGNGVIAYTAENSIWAVEPNTGDELRLTFGDDSDPSFSASGNLLAFQRSAGGTVTVYLSRADGSDARPLVQGGEPAFSPSGRQVVFVRKGGLFLTGLTPGSPVRRITNHPGDREPKWSSKGSIVFERTDIWDEDVKCIPSGTALGQLHQLLARGEQPCVKAGVRREEVLARQSELDLITPPSLRVRQLLTLREDTDFWPDWSPDGETVAVTLCRALPPHETESEPELPKLHYVTSFCQPNTWAPRGGALEMACCSVARSTYYSCPGEPDEQSEISWQPLLAGTLRVPTVPCAVTPLRTFTVKPGVNENSPRARVKPTKNCSRRHHKRHCRG